MVAPSMPSTLASWVPAVLRCLKYHGVEKDQALSLAGIDQTKLYEPDARFSIHDTHRLMALVDAEIDSPVPGLELARFADQTTFGALGFAMAASNSLGEALCRLSRFAPVISTVVQFSTHRHQYGMEVRVAEGSQASATGRAAFDFALAVITGFLRLKGGRSASPIKVCFVHQEDDASRSLYQHYYGCELAFKQPHYSLLIPQDCLDKKVITPHSEETRETLDRVLESSLSKLTSHELSSTVLDLIMRALPNGEPSLEEVAASLNVSGRTLQRRLKNEGVLFKTLLDEGRKNLSQQYLSRDGFNVTETAYLLGFSDVSSFSRAYRRWFNESPTGEGK